MKNSKTANEALQAIANKFMTGDLSPISDIVKIRRDPNDHGVPFNRWSFLNQMSVYLTKNTTDARTFWQWKEAGRKVKKGAKATYILAPIISKYTTEDEAGEEVEHEWLSGFKAKPVFAVEDTEGDPLPTFDYEPVNPPALIEVAQALGIPVKYDASNRPALGCYKPATNEIELYSTDTEVWFHELGHAVAEHVGAKFEDYNSNEVVAELTSAVLNMVYGGKDVTGNAWRYISAYSKDPLAAVSKAMKHVQKVLEFIEGVAA